MKQAWLFALALIGCAATTDVAPPPTSDLPSAGAGKILDLSATLTRIAFGSCNSTKKPLSVLSVIASEKPNLFVYMGDNVYGDSHGDPELKPLRETYAELAASPDFQALRQSAPMLITWDDHDMGANDVGRDYPQKDMAERIFEHFWNSDSEVRARPGVYESTIFGPAGKRVQMIVLDTRFFRSPLTPTDEHGAKGKERYLQSTAPDQDMLGDAQWAWLAEELKKPAELRFIVSSIQILADGHGFEAWRTLPKEQKRLYDLIAASGAKGVVLISGDRHAAALYRQEGIASYPLYEMTTSSLNVAFIKSTEEMSTNQLDPMFIAANFGVADVDWAARTLALRVKDDTGAVVRERLITFDEIGAG